MNLLFFLPALQRIEPHTGITYWIQRHNTQIAINSRTCRKEQKQKTTLKYNKHYMHMHKEMRETTWTGSSDKLIALAVNTIQCIKWKKVPAAQVSCGSAFSYAIPKASWLTTSFNYLGRGHQPTMGRGPSTNNGMRVINQLWVGGSSTNYG